MRTQSRPKAGKRRKEVGRAKRTTKEYESNTLSNKHISAKALLN
jgi:hypothetical protein